MITTRSEPRVLTLVSPRAGGFDQLVTEPGDEALRFVAEALGQGSEEGEIEQAVIVLLVQPETDDEEVFALHEAAFQSLRGIAGALTLELAGRLRVSIVRARSAEQAEPTLRYLASGGAGSVAGATLDLTGGFE